MRILHVITSLRIGGAEHLMVDILPRLRAYGHEVSLLLFDGTRTPFYEQLEKSGIRIFTLGEGEQAMHNPFLVFKLRKYLKQFDIIHTHNTPCQLLTAIASLTVKSTLVTTEHNTTNRRRNWQWYNSIDQWMYGRYKRIICVSKDAENNLIEALHNERITAKVETICNGIDIGKFTNAQPDAALKRQFAKRKLIGMIAAFRPQKDQATLIMAMRHLPADYHLLLIGDGECREKCEGLAESLGLKQRVHFLGARSDVPALLKTVDVVVLSSNYEGLSLSSIEGMASGKPFIASDVDGLHDMVYNAGLLFPHGDSAELTRMIQQVCEDEAYCHQIAQRCMRKAEQYDISQTVREYARVYEEVR